MKRSSLAALAAGALLTVPAAAQTTTTADTVVPVVTIDTGSVVLTKKAIISGTATDSGTTGSTVTGGVSAVYYQFEGQTKWRKALLTAKGTAETTWIIQTNITGTRGKRIYIRAVDASGNESDVVGRKFRRGS